MPLEALTKATGMYDVWVPWAESIGLPGDLMGKLAMTVITVGSVAAYIIWIESPIRVMFADVPRGTFPERLTHADEHGTLRTDAAEVDVLIIEHGDLIGQGTKGETGRVQIELVNFQGQKLSHGFHDGYGDLTKSIFFNVNSGIYNVLVKNSDGVLIASDTATVFDGGAITYLKTGNQMVAKSPDLSQSEATPEESDKKG